MAPLPSSPCAPAPLIGIRLLRVMFLWLGLMAACPAEPAAGLPAGPFANLTSEDFKTREAAQAELLEWARKSPETSMDELYRQSRRAEEPEARERCLAILRELIIDEYQNDGEGFIGVEMREEIGQVPGDPKPRGVIRITRVVEDSAASRAGLRINDLIAGLNGEIWRDGAATFEFTEKIRGFKPKSRITLKILREGALQDVEITLGRRPLIPNNPFIDERQYDLEAIERVAQDAYFRRWMEKKKSSD